MPAAHITVSYEKMAESYNEHIERSRADITQVFKCKWYDRILLAKQILGMTIGSTSYSPLEYDSGEERLYNIFAQSVSIVPFADKSEYAKLTVTFSNITETAPPSSRSVIDETSGDVREVWYSESLEPATEFMTLDKEGLYWDVTHTDPLNTDEVPAKLIRMVDWTYTLHRMRRVPDAAFYLPGKVNAYPVYSRSLVQTFPIETLLCGNPSMEREVDTSGNTTWTITFRFTYRNNGTFDYPLGWNHFPKVRQTGADVAWERIYDNQGSVKYIYGLEDFRVLIA